MSGNMCANIQLNALRLHDKRPHVAPNEITIQTPTECFIQTSSFSANV